MNELPFDPENVQGPAPLPTLPIHEDRGDPAHASDTLTEHSSVRVRIHAQPYFIERDSDPLTSQYIFGYRVRIANEGETTVQLLTRAWVVTDANGGTHEVNGEGVVGRQPRLHPGEGFTYESMVPIGTAWGTMEGRYHFEIGEGPEMGAPVEVAIGRFFLVAGDTPG